MNRQNEGNRDNAYFVIDEALEEFGDELKGFLRTAVADFGDHPGGSTHHHGYRHGLVIHTAEVVRLSWAMARKMGADTDVVLAAAIMHDWGKIYDYEIREETYCPTDGNTTLLVRATRDVVVKLPGYQKAAHIIASYDRWSSAPSVADCDLSNDSFHRKVGRCILSHHGQLAWGSVLTPSTPEEWCLHLADMASASAGVVL